ncbi:MAG TPA: hypothetical protein VFW87_00860 [Pirellulales bacterium]|nr:hypothetical protein [Pirellulales bacterium]
MSHRYAMSTATAVMLVVLRLSIGWHFFSEGVNHYTDPRWTSEPVLRAATGPFAPMYHEYLPDFHGMEVWLHAAGPQKPSSAVQGFLDEVQKDWANDRSEFAAHYTLDARQAKRADRVLGDYQAQLRSWGGTHKDELETHVHQWQRTEKAAESPDAADVPFRKQRVAQSHAALAGEASSWQAELKAIEREYHNALDDVLTPAQQESGTMPRPPTAIARIDTVMTCAILGIGGLLLLGLFTRAACVAGAVFLLSVAMTQPFWVSGAQPTFNQFVEMFALLTLATTRVGRWAGLDFFVHNVFFGREKDATKGEGHALDS